MLSRQIDMNVMLFVEISSWFAHVFAIMYPVVKPNWPHPIPRFPRYGLAFSTLRFIEGTPKDIKPIQEPLEGQL